MSDDLAENREAWEDWSQVDPLWAVATTAEGKRGRWDIDEFFSSGEATIAELWEIAAGHGLPAATGSALDFGCGPGRLTRALARRVDEVVGLDVSEGMIELARTHNAHLANASFRLHREADLSAFADSSFDVVCCLLVLQHLPPPRAEVYVRELVRILAPGGVLFLQLMTAIAPPPPAAGVRARLRPRTRAASVLRRVGVGPRLLSRFLGWEPPMPVNAIPAERAAELIAEPDGRIVWSRARGSDAERDVFYLVTR